MNQSTDPNRARLVAAVVVSLSVLGSPSVDAGGSLRGEKPAPGRTVDVWSQYRGPNRDGVSQSRSKVKIWTGDGPKMVWKHPLGAGFSGIVVRSNQLITAFGEDSTEYLASFERETGTEIWRVPIGKILIDDLGNGPRATPTLDGDLVFALGSYGQLHAVRSKTGDKIWTFSLADTFEIKTPLRGFTTSPLVQDGLVIVHAGGGQGEAFVALDKESGRIVWKIGDSVPSNSSPISAVINGVRQTVFAATRVIEKDGRRQRISEAVSVSMDGKILWKAPSLPGVIAMPVFIAPNKVFVSGSMDDGCLVLNVSPDADSMKVEEVWKSREMKNHFNSSVLYKNHLYGFSKATLKCLAAATAERKWAKRGFGKGSLIVVDDKLLVISDRGKLAIIEATGEKYNQIAVAQVLNGKSWTAPTFADGQLYLRNVKEMACYDLSN